ncbi:TPA: hypothetical protein ACN1ND_000263 [Enterococcus faecalis]|nr:hypothetical protein [Enterococcus faecalis]EKQ3613693.1 hypothetical protein [Enterococcus faecalis]
MHIDTEEVIDILIDYPNGLSLDELLLALGVSINNKNRINIASMLKWSKEIEKNYRKEAFARVQTVYKIIPNTEVFLKYKNEIKG